MTNDEIAERIKYVTMDEGDGVPGARFAREMAEEVLKLRAELARLAPLAEAAVACVDATAGVALWHKDDPFGPVMREAVRYVGKLRGIETESSDARAQAQDGA
jgi:hypothetical protein